MKRLHFLKTFATSVATASIIPTALAATAADRQPKPTIERPNDTAIMIYDEYIAGFRYYKGPKNLDTIQVDDEVKLIREPKNKYDEFAIAIQWEEKKLGYIRMDDNIVIANLIDNEIPLFAKISEVKKEAETWEQVAIAVYLLYPCK